MNQALHLWSLLTLIICGHMSQAYRILVISPIPSNSHAILGDATVQSLLDARQEVVYVTAYPRNFTSSNVLQVDVSSYKDEFPMNLINIEKIMKEKVDTTDFRQFFSRTIDYSEKILQDENLQKVVITHGRKIDLVIAEWMFTEMYAGLATLLECPLIWFSSTEPHDMILSLVDEPRNPAYTAFFGASLAPPFPFIDRVTQLLISWVMYLLKTYFVISTEISMYERIYTPLMAQAGKRLPSYDEVRFNASLVLSNSHVSMGDGARLPQNYIPIGGFHINSVIKPLTDDLQKVMDNAKNGVIYFSMGSIAKSKDFPEEIKINLLKMFSGLKQTIIWKFEEDFPNLPANVHILKWANQQAILAHSNCILFISHGGLLSLTESIYHGKPIIGIPIIADQFANVARGESKGFAKKVDLTYNLANELRGAILDVLRNPRFAENAKALSLIYHDRPMHPRKELAHWAEHVIKTHGAPHLRSPALLVPWYQKIYLDLALTIVTVLLVLRYLLKVLVAKYLGKRKSNQQTRDKKKL